MDLGAWEPIIGLSREVLFSAAAVAFLAAAILKGNAGANEKRQELALDVLKGSLVAVALGALAEPLFNLYMGFTAAGGP